MSGKLLAIPLALGLMGVVATADASPASMPGAAALLKADAEAASPLEKVHWTRCWSDWGYTRCWRPAPRVYSFYVRPRPYFYNYYGWGPRRWY